MKSISLRWILPVTKLYDTKMSYRYLSHVIGHEGPNSLLSLLIKENLAIGLSSGSSSRLNEAFDIFEVQISLTEKGEKDYE